MITIKFKIILNDKICIDSVPKKYFPLPECTGIPSLDAKFLSNKI